MCPFLSLPPIKLAHFIFVCWSVKLLHCITQNKDRKNFVPLFGLQKCFSVSSALIIILSLREKYIALEMLAQKLR